MIPAILLTGVFAQTPPIQPTTPIPQVPAPLSIPAPNGAEARPLTMEEAVQLAYQLSPVLEIARQEAEAAKGRTQAAGSDLKPQVRVTGSYVKQNQISGGSSGFATGDDWATGVTVEQLLFDFNRTRDAVRQIQALERAAEQGVSTAKNDLAFQVRAQFHTLAQAMENVAVSEANLKNRQDQLDLAQARLDDALGAPGDVVRARASVADAVSSLVDARAQELGARTQLALLMGIDPRTPFVITPETMERIDPPELPILVHQALELRPELAEAKERMRAAELGILVAKKGTSPSVTVSAGVSSRGTSDPFEGSGSRVGLNVNWPLFDSGFTAGRSKEASAIKAQVLADLTRTQLVVTQEVTDAWVALQAARQQLISATEQLANAEEAVRIAQGRYQGQLGTFLEVTDAQNVLVAAQRALAQARADYLRADAALDRAIGGDLPIIPQTEDKP